MSLATGFQRLQQGRQVTFFANAKDRGGAWNEHDIGAPARETCYRGRGPEGLAGRDSDRDRPRPRPDHPGARGSGGA